MLFSSIVAARRTVLAFLLWLHRNSPGNKLQYQLTLGPRHYLSTTYLLTRWSTFGEYRQICLHVGLEQPLQRLLDSALIVKFAQMVAIEAREYGIQLLRLLNESS